MHLNQRRAPPQHPRPSIALAEPVGSNLELIDDLMIDLNPDILANNAELLTT